MSYVALTQQQGEPARPLFDGDERLQTNILKETLAAQPAGVKH